MMRHMVVKTLSTSLAGLGASLLPSLSFGLGLGDIQVESRLNQPLYARIEIVDVSDEEWRLIRARIAPRTLLSEGSAHPEILASLTLRAVEDANHGHFIEIKSGDVLTEPLFDLPVEVAGQSLQVVRNYSVLLDPATSEDRPRSAPVVVAQAAADGSAAKGRASDGPRRATGVAREAGAVHEAGTAADAGSLGASGAAGGQYAAVAHVGAQAHGARHHRRHGARTHSNLSRKLASSANTAGASHAASALGSAGSGKATNTADAASSMQAAAGKTPAQEQLEGQLQALQQSLTKMQSTIAAQDAEIARLTAQIAARSESRVSQRPSTWVEYPARKSEVSTEDASDAGPGWLGARSAMFYWIGGAVVGVVVLTLGVVTFVRRRNAKMLREIALIEAARRQAPPKPAAPPTSERDLLAWQSNLRAAQSGIWKQSLEDTYDPTSEASSATAATAGATSAAHQRHGSGTPEFEAFGLTERLPRPSGTADLESAVPSGRLFRQSAQAPAAAASALASASASSSASASADTVATTVAIEELTENLEADLERLNASYEAEHLENPSEGIAAWRAQNEMLERDFLSDTEALPYVLEAGNQVKSSDTEREHFAAGRTAAEELAANDPAASDSAASDPAASGSDVGDPAVGDPAVGGPAAGDPAARDSAASEEQRAATRGPRSAHRLPADSAQGRSSRNREVAKILEQSLDFEPDRVDIQLKLLEIYHHEALGNRDNFESLLRKLAASQHLSPAQQLHVEKLQRTLHDGKNDTDSDFVAEVAI